MDLLIVRAIMTIGRRLYEKEMVNYHEGNLSVMKDGLIYITAGKADKAALREDQVCVLDGGGRQVFGAGPPSSELMMHRKVYEARGQTGAVIHAHPPCLTAYALCGKPVESRAAPEFIAHFGGCIRVAAYGRPGTPAVVEDALNILTRDDIALLANHGALAYGATLEEAFYRLETAERVANNLSLARRLGGEAPLPEGEPGFFEEMYANRRR
ncbi:MAG: class II aldolase/adducin family protein [Clostridia bacterium]|nr:class II aldolase/adducin family protein [Clostridia bacterium]